MTLQSKSLIANMLQQEHDTLMATKLHLQHQLDLNYKPHRVTELTDLELEESLETINKQVTKVAAAIREVSDINLPKLPAVI